MKITPLILWVKIALLMLAASIVGQSLVRAQDLWEFRIGDTPTKLSKLGPVTGIDKYRGMDVYHWILPDGNPFMATVNPGGEIVYVESDWGGKSEDTGCDLKGMKFNVTTLKDLEAKFGSEGLGFRGRPHSRETATGYVLLNSWEADKVVVTFYTAISAKDYAQVRATGDDAGLAEHATLVGISIADATYAKTEWGGRIVGQAYKKVEWK